MVMSYKDFDQIHKELGLTPALHYAELVQLLDTFCTKLSVYAHVNRVGEEKEVVLWNAFARAIRDSHQCGEELANRAWLTALANKVENFPQ